MMPFKATYNSHLVYEEVLLLQLPWKIWTFEILIQSVKSPFLSSRHLSSVLGGFHQHFLVFSFFYQFHSKIEAVVCSSFANDYLVQKDFNIISKTSADIRWMYHQIVSIEDRAKNTTLKTNANLEWSNILVFHKYQWRVLKKDSFHLHMSWIFWSFICSKFVLGTISWVTFSLFMHYSTALLQLHGWIIWQYRLWGFQWRDTKSERFLAKNQLKSNETYWSLKLGVVSSCPKLGIILENKVI